MQNKLWYIANTDLFACLKPSKRREMGTNARMTRLSKGQSLRENLSPDDHVYLIKEGVVKLVAQAQRDREVILGFLQPGDLVGESAIADTGMEDTDAIAEEDVLLCEFKAEYFQEILSQHAELAMEITKWIGLRFRRFQQRMQNLLFATPKERVATVLLELGEDFGKRFPDGSIRIGIKLTHQEIAQLVGLTRESVTHVFGDLDRDGLVRAEKRMMTILKPDKLKCLESPRMARPSRQVSSSG